MSEIESLKEQLEVATEALKSIAYRPIGGDIETYLCAVNMQNTAKAALTAIKDKAMSESKE